MRLVNRSACLRLTPVRLRSGLLDHLVGAEEKRGRNAEAERLRRDQVHDEIEFGRLLDRDVARLRPPQNLVDIVGSAPKQIREILADAKWQNVSWRNGTKGRLKARFAAVRVRAADGPPQRIWDKGQQHLPGDEAWLIGEHRTSGEKKYYLANLPAGADLRALAATIKGRWICEQAHQQLKEELGLDHFEGRSWRGLHRHALMTMIAYAFLQHRRLSKARREKKNQRTTASTKLASRAPRHRRPHNSAASAMPALPKMDRRRTAARCRMAPEGSPMITPGEHRIERRLAAILAADVSSRARA